MSNWDAGKKKSFKNKIYDRRRRERNLARNKNILKLIIQNVQIWSKTMTRNRSFSSSWSNGTTTRCARWSETLLHAWVNLWLLNFTVDSFILNSVNIALFFFTVFDDGRISWKRFYSFIEADDEINIRRRSHLTRRSSGSSSDSQISDFQFSVRMRNHKKELDVISRVGLLHPPVWWNIIETIIHLTFKRRAR